jgi:hypothetical protein
VSVSNGAPRNTVSWFDRDTALDQQLFDVAVGEVESRDLVSRV